jgi:hypothetical protein
LINANVVCVVIVVGFIVDAVVAIFLFVGYTVGGVGLVFNVWGGDCFVVVVVFWVDVFGILVEVDVLGLGVVINEGVVFVVEGVLVIVVDVVVFGVGEVVIAVVDVVRGTSVVLSETIKNIWYIIFNFKKNLWWSGLYISHLHYSLPEDSIF